MILRTDVTSDIRKPRETWYGEAARTEKRKPLSADANLDRSRGPNSNLKKSRYVEKINKERLVLSRDNTRSPNFKVRKPEKQQRANKLGSEERDEEEAEEEDERENERAKKENIEKSDISPLADYSFFDSSSEKRYETRNYSDRVVDDYFHILIERDKKSFEFLKLVENIYKTRESNSIFCYREIDEGCSLGGG